MTYTFPYPSQRMPVMAKNVVATSQPLAAQAGLRMLLKGGNAVDAALAAAITLTVVEPTSNGIGSDAFCILWDGNELHGLNASGRSPKALTRERFKGRDAMPLRGWDAVTVPGAVSAWVALSERFGKLLFEDLFEPAVVYAREGFLVSPITAGAWSYAPKTFGDFEAFSKGFLPGGPRAASGRGIQISRAGCYARGHRQHPRPGVLPGRTRRKNGGRRQKTRRPAHRRGLGRAPRRLGRHDFAALRRGRTARDSAERPGFGRPDGVGPVETPRREPLRGGLGRQFAPPNRGHEARLRRRLPLHCRRGRDGRGCRKLAGRRLPRRARQTHRHETRPNARVWRA